jgi:hypothetical protein
MRMNDFSLFVHLKLPIILMPHLASEIQSLSNAICVLVMSYGDE